MRFRRSRVRYGLETLFASSITRRILVLNIVGLVALLCGILYSNTQRAGLIEARLESLKTQGQIIAAAIASSASVETNIIQLDPNRLLELKTGESVRAFDPLDDYEFLISPERIGPVLRSLVMPTKTRARIYDAETVLLLDSQTLYTRGSVVRSALPAPTEQPSLWRRAWVRLEQFVARKDYPKLDETLLATRGDPHVAGAVLGQVVSFVSVDAEGQLIASVALPIENFRQIQGALLLSTQGGDIDAALNAERAAILRVFLLALAVMSVLSMLMANTIGGPLRRLSEAAERVRSRTHVRVEIPDFPHRSDEIGLLSQSLRDMTRALYDRMSAIERFAADVAHELKNPLTSLRSAVEVLPIARDEVARTRLLEVISHDVKRLDRLISDISDASRLDGELQRGEKRPIEIIGLLKTLVTLANEVKGKQAVMLSLHLDENAATELPVLGQDSRLAQVFHNLFDNARSFSPDGSSVEVRVRQNRDEVVISVDDGGPGIRPDALEKIFERFYTDRPAEFFGQNSGLGLSISKQIIEAMGGRIVAQNRMNGDKVLGARFQVILPLANAL